MALKTSTGVLIALVGVGVLVLVTVLGLGGYAFVTHVDIEDTPSVERVGRSFESARDQLPDRAPLLTLDADGTVKVQVATAWHGDTVPETLHVMGWEADEGRILTVHLPFWLLRFADDGRFELDTARGDPFTIDLTVDDLERHGPGLIVDHERPGRARVLIWTE